MTKVDLNSLVISTFVNDIKIMISKRSEIIQQIKTKLIAIFSIVNIGLISYYLGLKIE